LYRERIIEETVEHPKAQQQPPEEPVDLAWLAERAGEEDRIVRTNIAAMKMIAAQWWIRPRADGRAP
jgi:hypothetical protein